ncbi:AAA family ATPase [Natronomonas salina]|uniref:AAA family ATPase n=1 Tax=Natronomonas salina TaxID=1710540 RepID=UPI0015B66718|nr:AAA family ATPase [Natronomonas salina]QLD89102.1 AAA family ATPase [Natronomonas salina]
MSPRNSVERIPGGVDSQIASINKILRYVDLESPLVEDLADWLEEEFPLEGDTRADRVIRFLVGINILAKTGERLSPGPEGGKWLAEGADAETYFGTLDSETVGFREILEELFRHEASAEELNVYLADNIGVDWDTAEQVTRRLHYLRSIGYVELEDGRYSLSEDGRNFIEGKTVRAQFQDPPDHTDIVDVFDQDNPPEIYLVTQDIGDFHENQILIPEDNQHDISARELSANVLFFHLVEDEFRGYSRQSEAATETTQNGTRYRRVPVDVVRFDDPVSMQEVIGELLHADSITRPDSYPFLATGLADVTIGELGSAAAKTILGSVDAGHTYSEAVPEYEFENPPTSDEIEDLYYPGDGVLAEIIGQMIQALTGGQHIVLVGPPGTGKSELAKQVAAKLTDSSVTMVTATADWSSFDTIGGYQPEGQSGLNFSPGVFLDRFQDDDGNPTNEWLIVDELNRANVDKAFGSLFSALADDSVTTSFKADDGKEIELVTKADVSGESIAAHRYCVPDTWRLIATMNTHDKMSLFDLSYAFIRRFAFIHVGAPSEADITNDAIEEYLTRWKIAIDADTAGEDTDAEGTAGETSPDGTESETEPTSNHQMPPDDLAGTLSDEWVEQLQQYWSQLQPHRALGPAVIEKVARTLCGEDVDLTRPTKMYVIPQLEDLPRQTQENAIDALLDPDADLQLKAEEIITFSEDYLGINRSDLQNTQA